MNLYALAAIIAGIMFLVGVSLGWNVANLAAEQIRLELSEIEIYMKTLELEDVLIQDLDEDTYCKYAESRLPEMRQAVYDIGNRLQGKEPSEETFRLARLHVASIVKYWLYSQQVEERCGSKQKDIIFFYTIDDGQSKTQGFILDKLVREGQNITVLAINKNLDTPLVKLLVTKYEITKPAALIIDNKVYQGLQDYDVVRGLIS